MKKMALYVILLPAVFILALVHAGSTAVNKRYSNTSSTDQSMVFKMPCACQAGALVAIPAAYSHFVCNTRKCLIRTALTSGDGSARVGCPLSAGSCGNSDKKPVKLISYLFYIYPSHHFW